MKINIGIDIGGTFIKCAAVYEGKITASIKHPTPDDGSKLLEALFAASDECAKKAGVTLDEVCSIGVGAPGICDAENGILYSCPNIKGCEALDIRSFFAEAAGKEAYLDNDANCAALGEYTVLPRLGTVLFVTIGTGIGGGIIHDGRLLRGVSGGAGEIGHMTYIRGGELCGCGKRGCWEKYASTSALVRRMNEAGFVCDGKEAFSLAETDDAAKAVLEEWLCDLSDGICTLVNILQPKVIILGGGVSREGEKILAPIREYVSKYSMTGGKKNLPQTEIEAARLFNDAGALGAAMLYTQSGA